MQINGNKTLLTNSKLWGIFILYVFVSGYTIAHHELWGDELHSWNIAKASKSFFDLVSNTRYEGHPPVWYTILWVVSKFTHDVRYIQLIHFIIANLVVFLVLFFSPFRLIAKLMIPFGYFFLFEYGVISRNYSIALLFTFSICLLLNGNARPRYLLYYLFLFLLSNTHLLGMLMAVSLHLYFLASAREKKIKTSDLVLHVLAGIVILMPSIYFIFPPSDSSLGTHYWLQRWDIKQLSVIVKAPVRAFIPIPAWWNYHFWNTEFLLELQNRHSFMKWINLLLSVALIGLAVIILKKNKKSLFFFLVYLLLMFIVSTILPFANERQVGFIYIGFLAALWFYSCHNRINSFQNLGITVLLIIQLIAGAFAVIKDIKLPFSNGPLVKELVSEIPAGNKIVTDYWCLNTLSAFMDKPYYCIDLQKETSYLLWNKELATMTKGPDPYSNGLKYFFQQERAQQVYMISIHSPQLISSLDSQLFKFYKVSLVDKREGAIEKGSDLYLYQISTY